MGRPCPTQPVVTIEDSGGNEPTTSTTSLPCPVAPGPPARPVTCNGGHRSVAAASRGGHLQRLPDRRASGHLHPHSHRLLGRCLAHQCGVHHLDVGAATQLVFSSSREAGQNGAVVVRPAGRDRSRTAAATRPPRPTRSPSPSPRSRPAASLTCNGGSASMAATAGVAGFSGCQIVGPAGTYTLTATDSTSGCRCLRHQHLVLHHGRGRPASWCSLPSRVAAKTEPPGQTSPQSPSRTAAATRSLPPPTPSPWPSPRGHPGPASRAPGVRTLRPRRPGWPASAAARSSGRSAPTP